ncbi:MAG: hypothetical protein ACI9X4_002654 [Glaciecola sp.]|jgi:hypothetical protein
MNLPRPVQLAQAACLILLVSCSSWRRTEDYTGWSLYVKSGEQISSDLFFGAVQPAFEAVESQMGPFEGDIRVHAWNGGVRMDDGTKGHITTAGDGTISDIQDIGPARVRAFHARGDGGLFSLSGVFVGTADEGTAVHELVHARLAEGADLLPLWFEEGFAMVMGDGAMHEGKWVVDGLACWPWRELRELELGEEKMSELMELTTGHVHSVRDNVLVHFVGWAIVFDLYREHGKLDWQALLELHHQAPDPVKDARRRFLRTLEDQTVKEWLGRLRHADPGVRMATVRGTWKLHSPEVQRSLLYSLRREKVPEVRASMAVNALATAGQVDLSRRQTGWMWRSVYPVLARTTLESEEETSALRTLYRAYSRGSSSFDTQTALEQLDRFWED